MKVLIVDHSKVFQALWQSMVQKAGHQPIMASCGQEGLAFLKDQTVDLICVARSLSDTDGISFAENARKLPNAQSAPIVLLTSAVDKETRRKAFEAGVTDLCAKTEIDQLFNRAQRAFSDQEQAISGRVLYIEDSRTVSRIMIHLMHKMNLEVDHFTSAAKACEQFDQKLYDLVVSDILVEGDMSGVALVSHLREQYPNKTETPILAISGMEDKVRRVELFRLGINDFISKPVIMEEARARISNLITNKQLFDQVQEQRLQLYRLAMTDPLTGLYNRNSLSDFTEKLADTEADQGMQLSIILIDIDHFKRINDKHGHLIGDQVLREIGEVLSASCRSDDFSVRFGGEEFLLILPHCPLQAAAKRAQHLKTQLETLKPAGLQITVSIGVSARADDEPIDIEQIIKAADMAVYQAKSSGRNRVAVVKVDSTRFRQHQDGVTSIKDAG